MNEPRADAKKRDLRKIGFCVLAAAVLHSSLIVSLLPGGAGSNWQKIFRSCGLDDFTSRADGSPLAIHVLDVGKADGIFVECEGRTLLVDGGTADCGEQVASYLQKRSVKSIDLVVNTHPDSDHIGGLKTVLLRFPAARYLSPTLPAKLIPRSAEYLGTQQTLKSRGIREEHPKVGSSFELGLLHTAVLGPVRTC